MEEQQAPQHHGYNDTAMPHSETNDCKLTEFMGKEEEKAHEEVPLVDFEMVDKHEETDLNEKHTLLEELHCTRGNSTLSSDEEVEEGGETKKRKKKGLKDKIKEKISRTKEKDCTNPKDTFLTMEEGYTGEENGETTNSAENKGFLEKIKEKLPHLQKKTEEGTATPANQEDTPGGEMKEKKGILEKIKERLPGHQKTDVEPKEKEREN